MNEAIRPGPEIPSQAAGLLQLSVIVPTFNERDNVTPLFRRLEATLTGVAWEVIFVDDNSPDSTWDVVRNLAAQDSRVRCLRRIGRRGLSGACIEGILASSAPCAAVIALATEVAKRVLRVQVADPMSGFFMIRRDRFEQLAPQLSTQGFKILLDVVATAQGKLRTIEIPYTFGSRQHGESKLDSMVALDFLGLVLAKLTHDVVSLRFLLFAMVGSIGLFVHLSTLFFALDMFNVPFPEAQAAGALVAMTSTFILNNFLTYRDQRLKGFAILRGLLSATSPDEVRLARNTALAILGLVVLRLVAAAWTPLTFDEAYYWMWSKHLAGGYYDHPPGVAVVIRLGTMIAGDTELGVRLVSILLALPMSWAVYRAAAILFGNQRVAATTAVLLNVTLMAAVGTLIVTPDAPLLVASSFVVFF